MKFYFNGKYYAVPGAVSMIEAIRSSGASVPDFGITAIIGHANKGIPGLANNSTLYATGEASPESPRYIEPALLAQMWSDPLAVGLEYGFESEIYHAFMNFKLGGGGVAFIFDSGVNTRTDITLTLSKLWSMDFGVHTNDIYINIVTGGSPVTTAIEITKPRNTLRISADTETANYYVAVDVLKGTDIPYVAGEKVHLVGYDDAATPVAYKKTYTVDYVDYDNKRVYFTIPVGDDLTVVGETRLFQMDLDEVIESTSPAPKPITPDYSTTGLATLPEVKEYIESTGVFGMDITGAIALPVDVVGFLGPLAVAGTGTEGTSPADSATNWGSLLGAFTPIARLNLVRYIVAANNIDVTSSNLTRSWLDDWKLLETTLRTSEPINTVMIITGCDTGDTYSASSEDDSPETRASLINNDRFILTDIGLGGLPSYASFAPYVAGIMSSNIVNHNLTNDLINVATIEQERIERETVVGPRILAGILTSITKRIGNYVARGVNTLQNNSQLWTTDSKTHSIMQRNLADFCNLMLVRGLDNDVIGSDGITANGISDYVNATARWLISKGIIRDFGGCTVVRVSAGFEVDWTIKLDEETDWIGLKTRILVD